MKKNINGIEYDTKLSTKLFTYTNGFIARRYKYKGQDLIDRYYSEELYQTPSGEFFFCATGGKLTQYARPVQDDPRTLCHSTFYYDIYPKTQSEVAAWLKKHFYYDPEAEIIIEKILQK